MGIPMATPAMTAKRLSSLWKKKVEADRLFLEDNGVREVLGPSFPSSFSLLLFPLDWHHSKAPVAMMAQNSRSLLRSGK